MLVVASSNNGKSSLVNHFVREYPLDHNVAGEVARAPVVLVPQLTRPDEAGLYENILDVLMEPFNPRTKTSEKLRQVITVLTKVQPYVLAIDEINNLLAGPVTAQKQVLNALRVISNTVRLPIVGLGTKDALSVIQSDPQLKNRFEPKYLPRWEANLAFRQLLASFEMLLPLAEPSNLQERLFAAEIHSKCEGLIGELSGLLTAAATWSIKNGKECIDRESIKESGYLPSSKRHTEIPHL